MEDFCELARRRQSDRVYEDRPVEPEKLKRILSAARLAPSACNGQPWSIIVVDNAEIRDQLANAIAGSVTGMNHFSGQAPILLVIVEEFTNFTSRIGGWIKRKHFPHIDLGILASYITLAAADNGLGSCIIGWFNEKEIRRILKVPSGKRITFVITIGYTSTVHREKKRKKISDIVAFNRYGANTDLLL